MSEPMKRVITVAIEFLHARAASPKCFQSCPAAGRGFSRSGSRDARPTGAENAPDNRSESPREAHRLPEWPLPLPSNNGVEARRGGDDWQKYWPSHYQSCGQSEPEFRD